MVETRVYQKSDLNLAAKVLQQGGIIAFPTETVYGLGADATNDLAVRNVYQAKGRPSDNPLIVHISDENMLELFVEDIPLKAKQLMDQFWPGPLTIILKTKENNALSKYVTAGLSTTAFRLPDNLVTRNLIKKSGLALVGPSANTSGKPSPTSANHVLDDLNGKIEGVIDGGECQVGIESTVIDLSDDLIPTILRPGAITREQIQVVIGPVEIDAHVSNETEVPKSPGMKYKHYSPNTEVVMIEGEIEVWYQALDYYQKKHKQVGILASQLILNQLSSYPDIIQVELSQEKSIKEAMQHLFSGLRALDKVLPEESGIILVEAYEDVSENLGYMNRLKKAANQNKFIV
ncbi:L-threonylcarbamoyladenylate synthase [Vagococcus jeotgali]|uniref:L-threonylcarbamoyladenylate synthase n=1 Tax=Vagococcus jeotgali TaxID=3109030 RepID=UPI002DD9FF4A|nr:L-threonylcarbamoyladenylate synthase [Vagococcus sp. B2T-5]